MELIIKKHQSILILILLTINSCGGSSSKNSSANPQKDTECTTGNCKNDPNTTVLASTKKNEMIECASTLGKSYKHANDLKTNSCFKPATCGEIVVVKDDTKLEEGKFYFNPDEFKDYVFYKDKDDHCNILVECKDGKVLLPGTNKCVDPTLLQENGKPISEENPTPAMQCASHQGVNYNPLHIPKSGELKCVKLTENECNKLDEDIQDIILQAATNTLRENTFNKYHPNVNKDKEQNLLNNVSKTNYREIKDFNDKDKKMSMCAVELGVVFAKFRKRDMVKCNSEYGKFYKHDNNSREVRCDQPKKCKEIIEITDNNDAVLEEGKFYFNPNAFEDYIFQQHYYINNNVGNIINIDDIEDIDDIDGINGVDFTYCTALVECKDGKVLLPGTNKCVDPTLLESGKPISEKNQTPAMQCASHQGVNYNILHIPASGELKCVKLTLNECAKLEGDITTIITKSNADNDASIKNTFDKYYPYVYKDEDNKLVNNISVSEHYEGKHFNDGNRTIYECKSEKTKMDAFSASVKMGECLNDGKTLSWNNKEGLFCDFAKECEKIKIINQGEVLNPNDKYIINNPDEHETHIVKEEDGYCGIYQVCKDGKYFKDGNCILPETYQNTTNGQYPSSAQSQCLSNQGTNYPLIYNPDSKKCEKPSPNSCSNKLKDTVQQNIDAANNEEKMLEVYENFFPMVYAEKDNNNQIKLKNNLSTVEYSKENTIENTELGMCEVEYNKKRDGLLEKETNEERSFLCNVMGGRIYKNISSKYNLFECGFPNNCNEVTFAKYYNTLEKDRYYFFQEGSFSGEQYLVTSDNKCKVISICEQGESLIGEDCVSPKTINEKDMEKNIEDNEEFFAGPSILCLNNQSIMTINNDSIFGIEAGKDYIGKIDAGTNINLNQFSVNPLGIHDVKPYLNDAGADKYKDAIMMWCFQFDEENCNSFKDNTEKKISEINNNSKPDRVKKLYDYLLWGYATYSENTGKLSSNIMSSKYIELPVTGNKDVEKFGTCKIEYRIQEDTKQKLDALNDILKNRYEI